MDEEAKKKTDSGSQRIGQNIKTCTHWAPFLVIFLTFSSSAHTIAILEPFDAYVWEVAGAITIAIALISLFVSAFVPMAYCRYGCPTGAILKLLNLERVTKDGHAETT